MSNRQSNHRFGGGAEVAAGPGADGPGEPAGGARPVTGTGSPLFRRVLPNPSPSPSERGGEAVRSERA